ncbi:MAG: hypothetical protein ACRENE_09905 [Polyangiaceae bacterium]
MSEGWSTAYVAVSVALGEPLDVALGSISRGTGSGVLDPRCAGLVAALRSTSQEHRVQALARALAETALSVDGTGLA